MIKSYPGFGPVFLILSLILIGTWMCINPLLETNSEAVPNYGGLLFTAIGIGLLFSLKTITLTGDEIAIKQILTGKETLIEKDKISSISIFQDNRSYVEKHFSFHGRTKVKFQFHD
jgi:hypothetical protein